MTVKQQHQCFHLPSPPVTPLPPDTPVFVLGPRYDPSDPGAGGTAHISAVDSPLPLYLMMGRELFPVRRGEAREAGVATIGASPPISHHLPLPWQVPCASAGNVVGIGRLGRHVLKVRRQGCMPSLPSPILHRPSSPPRPLDGDALHDARLP